MADVGAILAKVRALGADVMLERGKMTIVGSVHLNAEQRAWLASNRGEIEQHLRTNTQSAGDPEASRPWGDFARMLYAECPPGVDPCDWSWFVMTAGKIVRGEKDVPSAHTLPEAETLQ